MSPRTLLEVALRILGIWFVFSGLNVVISATSFYLAGGWRDAQFDMVGWFLASGASATAQLGLGSILFLLATGVAARCYPEQPTVADSPPRVGAGDIYHVACFVSGVFILVQASEPAGRIVNAGFRGMQFQIAGDAFTMIVHLAAGAALIFGARRIGGWLGSLRYDPDSVPKQQFSLTILLATTALLAVLLGLIRWAATGRI